jgi:DNA-binding NarL/FixJ family response regulator
MEQNNRMFNFKSKQMESGKINLFIVADNALLVNGLKHYLEKRFGTGVRISNFYNKKSCLKKVNKNTQVVIVDSFLGGKSGFETLKTIKTINPNTEIIMHTSEEEVASSIEAFRKKQDGGLYRSGLFDPQSN